MLSCMALLKWHFYITAHENLQNLTKKYGSFGNDYIYIYLYTKYIYLCIYYIIWQCCSFVVRLRVAHQKYNQAEKRPLWFLFYTLLFHLLPSVVACGTFIESVAQYPQCLLLKITQIIQ